MMFVLLVASHAKLGILAVFLPLQGCKQILREIRSVRRRRLANFPAFDHGVAAPIVTQVDQLGETVRDIKDAYQKAQMFGRVCSTSVELQIVLLRFAESRMRPRRRRPASSESGF